MITDEDRLALGKAAPRIVVLGAGASGLAAAVAAAEKGGQVVLLEKHRYAGGNFSLGGGIFAAGSPLQKQAGIDVNKDDLFKTAMEHCHWKVDPRIVRKVIERSGDTIEWLMDQGVGFSSVGARSRDGVTSDVPPHLAQRYPMVMHCPEGDGPAAVKALTEKCRSYGVQMYFETIAKDLLLDDQGRLNGVIAETKEGEAFTIRAACVIIATGGFGGNKKMLKKHFAAYTPSMINIGLNHKGDGINMALKAGAATDNLGGLMLYGPGFKASFHSHIVVAAKEPNTLWVNKRAERYTDESVGYYWPEAGNVLSRQPEQISYTLFDVGIKTYLMEQGLQKPEFHPLGAKLDRLDKDLTSHAKRGNAVIADSWEEIAQWMGAAPERLKATVEAYNHCCDQGYDEMFVKHPQFLLPLRTPPYYALRCYQGFLCTIGGIKINHMMEVLDQQDLPIPGLFAAGNDAGGWASDTYRLALSGFALGFAFNGGRMAGENAAATLSQ